MNSLMMNTATSVLLQFQFLVIIITSGFDIEKVEKQYPQCVFTIGSTSENSSNSSVTDGLLAFLGALFRVSSEAKVHFITIADEYRQETPKLVKQAFKTALALVDDHTQSNCYVYFPLAYDIVTTIEYAESLAMRENTKIYAAAGNHPVGINRSAMWGMNATGRLFICSAPNCNNGEGVNYFDKNASSSATSTGKKLVADFQRDFTLFEIPVAAAAQQAPPLLHDSL